MTCFLVASEKPAGTLINWGENKIISAGSTSHVDVCGYACNLIFDLFKLF